MATRIYALAKQLKVDNKDILDAVKLLGIEGKGSALASLTDEETDQVKAELQKSNPKSPQPGFPEAAFRPPAAPLDKKIRVLPGPIGKKEPAPSVPQETSETQSVPQTTPSESAETEVSESSTISTPTSPVSKVEDTVSDSVPSEESTEQQSAPQPIDKATQPDSESVAESVTQPGTQSGTQPESESALPSSPTVSTPGTPTISTKTPQTPPIGQSGTKTKNPPFLQPPQKPKSSTPTQAEKPSPVVKPVLPTVPPPIGHVDLTLTDPKAAKKAAAKAAKNAKHSAKLQEQQNAQNQQQNQQQNKGQNAKPTPLNSFIKGKEQPAAPITTGFSTTGHATATRRDDYRGPMRVITDKIPNLDSNRKGEKPGEGGSGPSRPGVSIRMAPIPKAPERKISKSKEPAPQKPDAKLPPELLKPGGSSSKSIEDHIRNHEERQRIKEQERKSGKKSGKKSTTAVLPPDIDDKSRKGGRRDGVGIGLDASPLVDAAKKKHRSGGTRRNSRNDYEEETAVIPRQLKRQRNRGRAVSTAAPRKTDLIIQLPCSVKQFAEQTGMSVAVVMKKLLEMSMPLSLNAQLDQESAELLATAFEIRVTIREQVSLEDRLVTSMFEQEDDADSLLPRPPVVTVLGHVDHGKTTLLDHILHLNVVSGEKGGITQHIRAYRVKMPNGEDITFVDTPGHEAFTEMRARGANCTDIVVLVVAADDGIMPQTEEAISHAKAAGVPIIVALNKMDLPGVNPDRVIQELAAHELMPSEWGGDVEVIRCSGLTGLGVDKLLETIQVVAELHELKANPDRPAIGVSLEAELQSGQGVVCKVLVQNGTLRQGDVILCGTAYGRVKTMYDTLDVKKQINEAAPGTPVNLVGLDVAPKAGSKFCVLDDISDARIIAEQRLDEEHKNELADVQSHVTLETLFQRMTAGQTVQTLNIIIRADVRGSIEAIRKELGKLVHAEVKIKILQATVGGISEADVQLADASDAIIVGFNVVPDENARVMAERKKIQIRRYDIIYNLTDDIKKAMEGMLKPIEQVKEMGRALVQRVFTISRVGTIAGCRVISGTIERDCRVRLIRDSRIVGDYPLESLKREKDDVKEIREGFECGMKLKGFNDLKDGDILETYKIEEIARTF